MQVLHLLAGSGTRIAHQAKALAVEPLLARDRLHGSHDLSQQLRAGAGIDDGTHVRFRNDQDVNGGARLDIPKGEHPIVFIDLAAGDLAPGDSAKDAVNQTLTTPFPSPLG